MRAARARRIASSRYTKLAKGKTFAGEPGMSQDTLTKRGVVEGSHLTIALPDRPVAKYRVMRIDSDSVLLQGSFGPAFAIPRRTLETRLKATLKQKPPEVRKKLKKLERAKQKRAQKKRGPKG